MIYTISRDASPYACDTTPCEKCGYRLGWEDFTSDWIGRVSPDCPQCAGRAPARAVRRVELPNTRPCKDCGAPFIADGPSRRLCAVCRELKNRPQMRLNYAKHKAKKLARLKREMERSVEAILRAGAA